MHSVLYTGIPRLNILNQDRSPHRNLTPLIEVLNSFGLIIAPNENSLTISKDYGKYQINLENASVEFTPTTCMKCYPHAVCIYSKRNLCIIGNSRGWVNFPLLEVDLFILSIVFAILYDQLPENLLEQIKKFSHCLQEKPDVMTLDDRLLQDFRKSFSSIKIEITNFPQAPPILGPVPPP